MDSGPVIYEQRGRVEEHKSRPDGQPHEYRTPGEISGAVWSGLRTDSRSESRRRYGGRHAREIADARSSMRAMAPARPAPGNREHLCEAILTEPDRLYTSKLIPLIAQQHPHILYIFAHTKMCNFSARLPKYLPLLQILQLGPDWEPMGSCQNGPWQIPGCCI